jgi:hydrogenase nickel insertion protein HypA
MHEFSIAQDIVRAVTEANDKAGGVRVSMIKLRIGELSFIAEEQLVFAIKELVKGTKLAKAKVKIKKEPGKVKCPSCSYTGKVKYSELRAGNVSLAICPKCNSSTEIVGGAGCYVENISVELPEDD